MINRQRDASFERPAPFLNGATSAAAVLAVLILALDLTTSLDAYVLYVAPLLVGTFSGPPRFQFVAAGVVSALALLGGFWSSHGPTAGRDLLNRGLVLIVIWTTTLVLARFRRTWLMLQSKTKDLVDVNYAIDHSAIVATTDTKGTITYVNDKFCEISKYGREELLGQDHRLINSSYHAKEFIRDLWVTIANGRIWHGEIRNRAKDGSLYWVDTTIVPFLKADRRPYQYMAIRYDITQRKRSEELLREQSALARLGQMAAVVAHEVKNPIAGIRGALQVIASRMPTEARDRAVVGDIIARLDGLNGIVQDLLVFARPRELKLDQVDLAALVSHTAALIARDPALSSLRIHTPTKTAAVLADREQLQIVFQNILMNAAQAMGGTGDIDVAIEPAERGWQVAIADHGPGMSADVREQAFAPFFTTKHRGTGLGLPTARRFVEAHGGHVALNAPPGGGTVVTVFLPSSP